MGEGQRTMKTDIKKGVYLDLLENNKIITYPRVQVRVHGEMINSIQLLYSYCIMLVISKSLEEKAAISCSALSSSQFSRLNSPIFVVNKTLFELKIILGSKFLKSIFVWLKFHASSDR